MYRHYTAVRSVPRKLRAIEGFSHKGESVKRGSTVLVDGHSANMFNSRFNFHVRRSV